jgi:heptosyltransferase-2
MIEKICIVYSHHKLGDLIWQLPYIKAISEHHNKEIDLIVREKTQAKEILKDLNYINTIHYNDFRKKIFYWVDVFKLKKIFSSKDYTHVYILDKINKPAVAAKLAGIKNIIGPGIKRQKKWLTNKNFLNDKDWLLSYSEQSQKLLKINNIKIKDLYPHIEVKPSSLDKLKKKLFLQWKKNSLWC